MHIPFHTHTHTQERFIHPKQQIKWNEDNMHTPTGNKTANGLTSKAININRRPTNNCGCCRLPEHHCRRLIYIEYESGWLVGWADKHVIHLIKDICNANWVCEHMLFAHDAQRKPAQSKAKQSKPIDFDPQQWIFTASFSMIPKL